MLQFLGGCIIPTWGMGEKTQAQRETFVMVMLLGIGKLGLKLRHSTFLLITLRIVCHVRLPLE